MQEYTRVLGGIPIQVDIGVCVFVCVCLCVHVTTCRVVSSETYQTQRGKRCLRGCRSTDSPLWMMLVCVRVSVVCVCACVYARACVRAHLHSFSAADDVEHGAGVCSLYLFEKLPRKAPIRVGRVYTLLQRSIDE